MAGQMRKIFFVLLAAAALGAGAFGYRLYMLSELRAPVLAQLSDPDSATFRNEVIKGDWWYAKGSILCGEVNAKNKMGGYIGYQKFSSFGGVEADIGHTPSMDSLVQAQCDI